MVTKQHAQACTLHNSPFHMLLRETPNTGPWKESLNALFLSLPAFVQFLSVLTLYRIFHLRPENEKHFIFMQSTCLFVSEYHTNGIFWVGFASINQCVLIYSAKEKIQEKEEGLKKKWVFPLDELRAFYLEHRSNRSNLAFPIAWIVRYYWGTAVGFGCLLQRGGPGGRFGRWHHLSASNMRLSHLPCCSLAWQMEPPGRIVACLIFLWCELQPAAIPQWFQATQAIADAKLVCK